MPVRVTNNTGADYRLPDRRLIPDGESVILSDTELEWIPLEKRDASLLEITALSSPVTVSSTWNTVRIDEPSSTTAYFGYADSGSDEADSVWLILKMTETGSITKLEFANGSDSFNQAWDDRASLTYS